MMTRMQISRYAQTQQEESGGRWGTTTREDEHASMARDWRPVPFPAAVWRNQNTPAASILSLGIQRKASVSVPSDPLEKAADEGAEKLLRMEEPALENGASGTIQRKCAACEEDEDKIHAKRDAGATAAAMDTSTAIATAERPGMPLPRQTRAFFEPRMRTDLGDVRVHADADAARAAAGVQAKAYTWRNRIVFGAGEYAPETHAGKRLLAHELMHVGRGRVQTISREPIGTNRNEELRQFLDEQPYGPMDYESPTGYGAFSVSYSPYAGILFIRVRCKFEFLAGLRHSVVPNPIDTLNRPSGHLWTPTTWSAEERISWIQRFLRQVSNFWSLKHRFQCKKKGLESLSAVPQIRFVETSVDEAPDFLVKVFRGRHPDHRSERSHLLPTKISGATKEGNGTKPFWIVKLDEMDIDESTVAARHEAGHMLGLGDEYAEEGYPSTVDHGSLVKAELGHDMKRRKDDKVSIMAEGTTVLREHGVLFLDALRKVTNIAEWKFAPVLEVSPEP